MMRILLVIGLLVFTEGLFGQIRVSHPVKDLGDIFEKSGKVTVSFELTNPYRKDTIYITEITTSCGCTAVLSADTLIPPQTSTTVDVSYDPTGRLGLFVKSVELTTRTGEFEQNKLFLKIAGNVVAENFTVTQKNQELLNYVVAPIYFYPITAYDTSYLDFNYIGGFIDDLTYEIDFYQFTTIGIAVDLPGYSNLEEIENLLFYLRKKIMREFNLRGFKETAVFFEEPIFRKATDLPGWAGGGIRLYSLNFDAGEAESQIQLSTATSISESKVLLDYERFALPTIEEVVNQVNLETIEGKLFLNGELDLNGTILMPWKKSRKLREKTAKKLRKALQKKIDQATGAGKKEVRISFDSLGVHEEDKYRFILWDDADLEETEQLRYVEKPDQITPPLLPTYKGFPLLNGAIDKTDESFQHFWENCRLNAQAGQELSFLILMYRTPNYGDEKSAVSQLNWTNFFESKFRQLLLETFDSIPVNISSKQITHGFSEQIDLPEEKLRDIQPEPSRDYYVIIPLVHHDSTLITEPPRPYMVNFDFFFKGIDTGAWGFQRFAKYLSETVRKEGYVELRIESGISKIPVEEGVPNKMIAYKRLLESENRIRAAMAKKLIDPNRIIFVDERVVEQGPEYDGTVPILKYRDFHYLRLIPEESLK